MSTRQYTITLTATEENTAEEFKAITDRSTLLVLDRKKKKESANRTLKDNLTAAITAVHRFNNLTDNEWMIIFEGGYKANLVHEGKSELRVLCMSLDEVLNIPVKVSFGSLVNKGEEALDLTYFTTCKPLEAPRTFSMTIASQAHMLEIAAKYYPIKIVNNVVILMD